MNKKNNNKQQERRPQKERFNTVTFKKSETDFVAGLEILRKIYSINNVFATYEEDQEEKGFVVDTEELAKNAIVSHLYNYIPVFNDRETRFYALNMSAYKVSYKLGNNIAFGWQINYNRETKESTYEFMVVVTSKDALDEVEETLKEWDRTEKTSK